MKSLEGQEIVAHSVIIATGARANYLGLDSENKYKNMGVSACAVCDGALPRFRERPLVVIGGGDSAMEESNYLTKFASKVYIVHRRDSFRASKIMAERALSNPKIEVKWNSTVDEVIGNDDEGVTAVRIRSSQRREEDRDSRSLRVLLCDRPHAEHRLPEGADHSERQGLHRLASVASHEH